MKNLATRKVFAFLTLNSQLISIACFHFNFRDNLRYEVKISKIVKMAKKPLLGGQNAFPSPF